MSGTALAAACRVRAASPAYRPRQPDREVLHQLVCDHFETLRARVADRREGQGLPAFVEREFREFVTCGSLAAGFARFRCRACGRDRLVAFSCKGRGFCPSCGGRRMTERAAQLVDRVFPRVPVRQWVLTLPPRLRYLLAFDHASCRAVTAAFLSVVFAWLRRRARRHCVRQGRAGAAVILQRFGAALNLNVHVHALVLDGVFVSDGAEGVRFESLDREGAGDEAEIVAALVAAILPVVPGFVRAAMTPGGRVAAPTVFDDLYTYAWFVTFGLSAGLYVLLMRRRVS